VDQAQNQNRQAQAGRSGDKGEKRAFQAIKLQPQSPEEQ
jgi:hypothetical protein